jgi:alpha-mannosidase
VLAAEKWAAVAAVLAGVPVPVDRLGHAWRQVLFNQFHDILAGTSIEPAYEDARNQLGEARAIAGRIRNRCLQSISRRIDIPAEAGTTPLVVFNPHPWPVRTTVELEFGTHQPVRAVDDAGREVPVQTTRSYALTGGRRRLVLPVDLPPLGYRLYRLTRHAVPGPEEALPADGAALENEHLRVVVDPETGWLASLLDKATGNELVEPGRGQHAVVVDDPTDTWGHGVISYRRAVGRFEPTSVRLVENGPVRSVLRIESRYGSSCAFPPPSTGSPPPTRSRTGTSAGRWTATSRPARPGWTCPDASAPRRRASPCSTTASTPSTSSAGRSA